MSKNKKTVTLSNRWGDWRFEDLTLMLDSRLTVFTGAMGSGKTSILEAIVSNPFLPFRVFTNKVCSQSFNIRDVIGLTAIKELIVDSSLDVTLPFTAYSSGEQAIIRLYCSISSTLGIMDSDDRSIRPIVVDPDDRLLVLIDDLGRDLHPIWQHKILPLLLKDFPTVHFVVTTTSPLVLTHVQPDSLFFVEKGGEKIEVWQATESYGKTAERILEDLQGLETTRPVEVQECLHQFYRYLDSSDLINAEKELAIARDMTGHNVDPELTRMELRLKTESRQNRLNSYQNEINYNYTLDK